MLSSFFHSEKFINHLSGSTADRDFPVTPAYEVVTFVKKLDQLSVSMSGVLLFSFAAAACMEIFVPIPATER